MTPTVDTGAAAQTRSTCETGCYVDPRVERTRAAILDASQELLMTGGPDAVTHVQVAAAANVSRTTVYKHHPDRAALLRATIEHVGKPYPVELTGDLRTDLLAFMHDIVEDFSDEQHTKAFATFIERAQHDEEIAEVRDSLMCDGIDQFNAILERGVAGGELRADIDMEIAMASLMGTFFFRRFMANEPVDHAFAGRLVDEFLRQNAA